MPRLRHQLIVLQRKVRGRVHLTNSDRLFFIQLYRWFPSVLKAITIVRPETLVRWHRAGFCRYWRWKSRSLRGRPPIDADLRVLINLAGPTKHLAHVGAFLVAGKRGVGRGVRIEALDGVGRPVGRPYVVFIIDMAELSLCDMACSSSLVPLASFAG